MKEKTIKDYENEADMIGAKDKPITLDDLERVRKKMDEMGFVSVDQDIRKKIKDLKKSKLHTHGKYMICPKCSQGDVYTYKKSDIGNHVFVCGCRVKGKKCGGCFVLKEGV